MLTSTAPAKLNLGLHVLRKRQDGYHDIDSILVRIGWCDLVHADASPTLTLTCSDPDLPVDERNLCMKAALALRDALRIDDGAAIHLEKHIPAGAGLGGGSSDAATTLRLLCRLWDRRTDDETLSNIAGRIGSDVPFFLGSDIAHVSGRGEVLEPLSTPDLLMRLTVVVAVPPIAVSTAGAYALVLPREDRFADLTGALLANDTEVWRKRLTNDFEGPVSSREPLIGEALAALDDSGALYRSMSGTGSAVFGMFSSVESAEAANAALLRSGHRTWVGSVRST